MNLGNIVLKKTVAIQIKGREYGEKFKSAFFPKEEKLDEGSFLTENATIVAITVAIAAVLLIGMLAIMGTDKTDGTVLGTISKRITAFFTGK